MQGSVLGDIIATLSLLLQRCITGRDFYCKGKHVLITNNLADGCDEIRNKYSMAHTRSRYRV